MSNTRIEHSDVDVLIDEGEVREIFAGIEKKSQAFKLLSRLPNMSSNKEKLKVLDSLPVVYWQESSTSRKKITKMKWDKKYLYAEELAVVIPIAEADVDDASYDIWGAIRPKLEEAVGQKIDHAVFFGKSGEDVPANFPDGLFHQAFAKGYARNKESAETIYNAISETMGLVEDAGYSVNGLVAGPSIKKVFRGMVDTTGQLITGDEISALPRAIIENGAWDKDKAIAMVGDFKEAVFALRQDMSYKLFDQGVVQDPSTGEILYNLMQDDMVALRVTFRFGWQIPNPVNILKQEEGGRLPFAVLSPVSTNKVGLTLTPSEATTFSGTQKVKMKADVHGAKIYYTLDGSTPTTASTEYTAEITLSATKTVKAIAVKDGYANSDVVSVTYTKA